MKTITLLIQAFLIIVLSAHVAGHRCVHGLVQAHIGKVPAIQQKAEIGGETQAEAVSGANAVRASAITLPSTGSAFNAIDSSVGKDLRVSPDVEIIGQDLTAAPVTSAPAPRGVVIDSNSGAVEVVVTLATLLAVVVVL